MITIHNQKKRLYQWDLGQRLIIEGYPAGTEVHCALMETGGLFTPPHGELRRALVVVSYDEDGIVYANIPNILLQQAGELNVYIYPENGEEAYTAERRSFTVIARERPSDYVYSEIEIKRWEELAGRADEAIRTAYDAADAANAAADAANDAAEKALFFSKRALTYINVFAELGGGSASAPIDLSSLDITDHSVLYFAKATYYLRPLTLSGIEHLTVLAHEAKICLTGNHFIEASNCPYFSIYGGEINGSNTAQYGIALIDSPSPICKDVVFADFGNASLANVSMLRLFGDCTGFDIEDCTFDTTDAGVISDSATDNFIHAYGILINRLGSSNTYSASGSVCNCTFDHITSTDGEVKGDGDGIFIQMPPYIASDGSLITLDCKIIVEGCVFKNCKKRGIKSRAYGVEIRNCSFEGAFWYACIDLQEGHNTVRNCKLINTSDYNNSVTSALVASDGGFTVEDCTICAPYYNSEDGTNTFHPGIRTTTRLPQSAISDETPWDAIRIHRCYFDGVSRGVYVYNSNEGATTYTLEGIEITDCRFGVFNQTQAVNVSATVFSEIGVFRFTDFRFDWGINRTEVKAAMAAYLPDLDRQFVYPVGIGVNVTRSFELYSRYWIDEPMSGYDGLPTAYHTCILYEGGNMGGITYKKYTTHGSELVGTRDPASVVSTLGKQLLYNSKIGDRYINSSNGSIWICTAAGSSSTVGTWTAQENASGGESSVSSAEYRLIRDITVPEDITTDTESGITWYASTSEGYETLPAGFTIDTDDSGEPFELCEMYMAIYPAEGSSIGYSYTRINGIQVAYTHGTTNQTTYHLKRIGDAVLVERGTGSDALMGMNENRIGRIAGANVIISEPFKKLRWDILGLSGRLAAGTIIRIWGV